MNPNQPQPPQDDNQDHMLIEFLQELDARITALEDKETDEREE